jgi:SAM-dependent methyltransferase
MYRAMGPPIDDVSSMMDFVSAQDKGRTSIGQVDERLGAYLVTFATSNEDYVDAVYRLVLRREPEPEACERAVRKLAEGTLSRATLLHELVAANEYVRIRLLDDAVAFALGARERGERPRLLTAPPGMDERVVEIPWVLARVGSGRALEVGHAFAEPAYLAALMRALPGMVVGVDLVEREISGMECVTADVRSLPFSDSSFDQVLLVSTLEHVGADNSVYGLAAERGGTPADALAELRRVLRPDGTLLVTVPVGEPEDYGWFRQYDRRGWTRLFTRAGFFVEEEELYELADDGWRANPAFEARGVRYGERGPAAAAVLCAELSPRRLRRLLTPDGARRSARRRLAPAYRKVRPRGR